MTNQFLLQAAPFEGLMMRLRGMAYAGRDGLAAFAVAFMVLVVGWLLARAVSLTGRALLRRLGFNAASRRLLGDRLLGSHEPAQLAAAALHALVLACAAVLAVDVLGFDLSGALAYRFSEVIPRVLAASLLLVGGSFVAILLGGLAQRFFANAGLRGARLRGQIVTGIFTFFAVVVALEQLGFAAHFVLGIALTVAGAAGLALALAVGLGCRDLARDFVIEYLKAVDDEKQVRP
ncbi:MAG: hypothetical protein ABIS67_00150 [Candidatus Eisenbacteria bacterium]